jgi:hypothetical protein
LPSATNPRNFNRTRLRFDLTFSSTPDLDLIIPKMVRLHNPFHVQAEVNGIAPPKETVNFRIIMLGLFGACAALMYGYDLG